MRYVAFLRAINVAGHATVRMDDLKAAFEAAGCRCVRSYIQSGNLLFEAPRGGDAALLRRIEKRVHGLLGSRTEILLRRAGDLRRLVKAAPFEAAATEREIKLYASFLGRRPAVRPKLPLRSPRGEIEIVGLKGLDVFSVTRKVGGRYGFPNNFVEKELGVPATTRNWNTVARIADLASEP